MNNIQTEMSARRANPLVYFIYYCPDTGHIKYLHGRFAVDHRPLPRAP